MQGRKLIDAMGKTSANMPGVCTSVLMRIQVKSLLTGHSVFLGEKNKWHGILQTALQSAQSPTHNPKK